MASALAAKDLRAVLRDYLAGEISFEDFREWEVSVTDTDAVPPEHAGALDRLALAAEMVISNASDMSHFDAEVRAAIDRIEA